MFWGMPEIYVEMYISISPSQFSLFIYFPNDSTGQRGDKSVAMISHCKQSVTLHSIKSW